MLQYLSRANSATVNDAMKTASPDLIRTPCECPHNILKGKIRLNPSKKKQLRRRTQNFRVLTSNKDFGETAETNYPGRCFIGLLLLSVTHPGSSFQWLKSPRKCF